MNRHARQLFYFGWGNLAPVFNPLAQAAAILAKYGGSLWVADPRYTFTGSDGTGAASIGGSVGYVRDLVGTRHATQATTARKPLLQLSGGKLGLKFDGVDDLLLTATLPSVTAETFGLVYTAPSTTGSAQFPINRRNTADSSGAAIYLNGTNNTVNFLCGTGAVVVGAAVAAGNVGVASVVGKVGSLAVRVNGSYGATTTYATYVCGSNALSLGNSVDVQRPFGGTVHAAYYAPTEISNADRQVLDRLLGKQYGVTVA